ncbi:MAG: hypothetical protein ABI563_12055 [Specibacter sp.]
MPAPRTGLACADSREISADTPASLPLLIRFDKFVAGTHYQGLTELALRPGSPVINEEHADKLLGGNGVLFKADAESSFTYQGDDQKSYEEHFKQLDMEDSRNLAPIITFLKWLDGADSATFDAELANWVDVASFAK